MVTLRIFAQRLKESLFFDSRVVREVLAAALVVLAWLDFARGRYSRGTDRIASVHRAALSPRLDRVIEGWFRSALKAEGGTSFVRGIRLGVEKYAAELPPTSHTLRFFKDPSSLMPGCMIVLKKPTTNERGVLYLYYSYVYPLLLQLFDAEAIAARYRIVIEPSWSGLCDLNVLCLSTIPQPVVVATAEPRDEAFLNRLDVGFVTGDFAGNTWVDPRVFRPLDGGEKVFDVVSVAAWSWYKRHWALFRALSELKRRRPDLRVALVGYPAGLTKEDILQQAARFGLDGSLTVFERLPAAQVSEVLASSRVNVLWSRREGSPRATIEGMAAGVPFVIRRGFNYGHEYGYVTPSTGAFADEASLPDVLDRMIAGSDRGEFKPREWMLERMTPEATTQRLNSILRRCALENGEEWTRDIAVKVSSLDGLEYANPRDAERFSDDYAFIAGCVRR